MRNQAKLFKTDLAGTQFVLNMQPRKPLNVGGASGGFDNEESPNSLQLGLDTGTGDLMAVGHAPGTYCLYFDGATSFVRPGHDAALYLTGDATLEAILKCEDVVWPALTDVMGFSGDNGGDADNYNLTMGIDTAERHPKYRHESAGPAEQSFTWTGISLPAQEWIYMALVRDSGALTVTLYINGVAQTPVFNYGANASGGGGTAFGLGANNFFNVNYFQGWLSGVRIRDVAATAAQIAATADRVVPNKGAAVFTPPLLPEVSPSTHASLTSWVEAGSHDIDDGDSVQTLTTLAGAASDFTQATLGTRPLIYPAAGELGLKMYDGTAARQMLPGVNISDFMKLNPAGYHVYVPFLMHSADLNSGSLWQNHRLFGDAAGWWGAYARRTGGAGSGDFEIYGYHWDTGAKITPHVVSLSQVHLFEFWYDTANTETVSRIDDGPEVRVTAGVVGGEAAMELGGPTNNRFLGVIFGAMFADGEDAATRAGIRNYYSNKYGMDV